MGNNINIYCDGGARGNPGPAASAFVVYDNRQNIIYEDGVYIGNTTNNQAEYQAVINALKWLGSDNRIFKVIIHLDSLLIVNQLKRSYKVKEPVLKQKFQEIISLLENAKYEISDFVFIPREQNTRADFLVNLALDKTLYSEK